MTRKQHPRRCPSIVCLSALTWLTAYVKIVSCKLVREFGNRLVGISQQSSLNEKHHGDLPKTTSTVLRIFLDISETE